MTNGSVNYFPWEETKEDNTFPTMIGQFRIKSIEDGQSNNSGKRMFRAIFECVAPLDYAGQQHFENYVVGSDEAPMAILPGQFGTRNFKKLCKASQVPPNNDINILLQSMANSELLLSVVEYEETQEGQYKGDKRNRISGYFRVGEREVAVAPVVGKVGAQTATVSAPRPTMPAAPAMPAAPVQQAAPVASAAPAPPVQPAPVAPAPPAAAPVTPAAAPVAPAAPPTPAAPGTMVRCTMCNADVPVADFAAHVQAHMAGQ